VTRWRFRDQGNFTKAVMKLYFLHASRFAGVLHDLIAKHIRRIWCPEYVRISNCDFIENECFIAYETCFLSAATEFLYGAFVESFQDPDRIAQPIDRSWRSIAKVHIARQKRESGQVDCFKQ
jgi:hypothetical protein